MMGLHSAASPTRRGFTLTELAIVLGIMGTILGAIWTAAARVSANNKAQKAAAQVQMILSGYRSLFAQHAVDTGAGQVNITCLGMNAGFFPSEMMPAAYTCSGTPSIPSTYPSTPWGSGTVVVWGDQASNGITISYYSISQSACIALAMAEANAPDLILSYVGASGQGPHQVNYPASGPMSTTTINTDCADSATNDEVSFEYKAR